MRNGAFFLEGSVAFALQNPAALFRLLQAFNELSLWNQNAEPCHSLVPLLVMALKTELLLRPYSPKTASS